VAEEVAEVVVVIIRPMIKVVGQDHASLQLISKIRLPKVKFQGNQVKITQSTASMLYDKDQDSEIFNWLLTT